MLLLLQGFGILTAGIPIVRSWTVYSRSRATTLDARDKDLSLSSRDRGLELEARDKDLSIRSRSVTWTLEDDDR